MEEYIAILKDLAEGKIDIQGWRDWWRKNADCVKLQVERKRYLSLKYKPMQEARKILQGRGIEYRPDETKCPDCGSPLFSAIPGVTKIEEIQEFARRSRIPGWETILVDGWLHPGQYCPNGCIKTLYNLECESYQKVSAEGDAT